MKTNILLNFNLKNYRITLDNLLKESESNNSIYSGKSGAVLFLLELYGTTQEKSFLHEAEDLAKKIYNEAKNSPTTSFAFFTGNMGVSYMLLQLFNTTENQDYIDQSTHIAKNSKNHLALQEKPIIDLINGLSGILLGLLHLHTAGINDDWLLEDIKFYIDYIISKSEIGKKGGIYWDLNHEINQGLTGYSHGASGIGFVFYEIFKITRVEGFKYLYQQALRYENSHFNKEKSNWYDHRRMPIDELDYRDFIHSSKNEDISFFLEEKFMTAWCHGAPGIILSRYNAKKDQARTKLAYTSVSDSLQTITNHSLCHGPIGNALCLLSCSREEDADFLSQNFDQLSSELISYFTANSKFISGYGKSRHSSNLFMGDLGAFYFLLKSYQYKTDHPLKKNSILYPALENSKKSGILKTILIDYNAAHVSKMILNNHYPRTIEYLKKYNVEIEGMKRGIEKNFKKIVATTDIEIIKDAYRYESAIGKAVNSVESFSYNYYRNKADIGLLESEAISFQSLRLFNNPYARRLHSLWRWDSFSNPKWSANDPAKQHPTTYLIVPKPATSVIIINNFVSGLLDFLTQNPSSTIKDVTDYFMPLISSDESEKEKIENLIAKNIIHLIKLGAINIQHEKNQIL